MEKHLLDTATRHLFNKKETILVQPSENLDNSFKTQKERVEFVAAMLTNLDDLGYTIPTPDIAKLLTMSPEDLNKYVYQPILEEAKQQKGAHVEHNILFQGFPYSIKNIDESVLSNLRFATYFTSAADAYWGHTPHQDGSLTRDIVENVLKYANAEVSGSKDMSDREYIQAQSAALAHKAEERGLTANVSKIRTVHVASEEDYFQMVKNMLSSKAALPDYDKEIVLFTVNNFPKKKYMPEKVGFRETQALLDAHNFRHRRFENIDVRTIADVERLCAALSSEKGTLRKDHYYIISANADRKALATVMKNAMKQYRPSMIESAASKKNAPFIEKTLKGCLRFDTVKEQKEYFKDAKFFKRFMKEVSEYRTVMSQFEENMKKKEFATAAKILGDYSSTLLIQRAREIVGKACQEQDRLAADKTMPTEEKMIRQAWVASDIENIKGTLAIAARKTDVISLMKMANEAMKERQDFRVIRDSKNNNWIFKENKSVPLNADAALIMINTALDAMNYQYEHMPVNEQLPIKEGMKIYLDDNLEFCPPPTDDRAAQGKNRLLSPGTRIPFAPGDVLQVSLFKKAANQFIDHSFAILDENFRPVMQGSWNNMSNKIDDAIISLFTGDTMHCENGATETHEIYLKNLAEKVPNGRYIAFSAIMWDGNALDSAAELFMEAATFYEADRVNKPTGKKGEQLIDPKNVQMKMDIAGQKSVAIPILWDIKEHKMIVVNVELSKKRSGYNINNALAAPVHFKLPAQCEALENYQTEVAAKCYAATQTSFANMKTLVSAWVAGAKAILVDDPTKADIIVSTGRSDYKDERPREESQELPPRKVVTIYDKDVILNAMIPDAKAIAAEEQRKLTERRQTRQKERQNLTPKDIGHEQPERGR